MASALEWNMTGVSGTWRVEACAERLLSAETLLISTLVANHGFSVMRWAAVMSGLVWIMVWSGLRLVWNRSMVCSGLDYGLVYVMVWFCMDYSSVWSRLWSAWSVMIWRIVWFGLDYGLILSGLWSGLTWPGLAWIIVWSGVEGPYGS